MSSRGVNKAIIIGNVGQDPILGELETGAVCKFSVATSESWRDKVTGQEQSRTEWHRVVVFGKLADICGQYLKKGSKVYIEGSLRTRKWQNKDGVDMYTTEIVAVVMQMLDSRSQSDDQAQPDRTQQSQSQAYTHTNAQGDDFSDDIPF